MKYNLSEIMKLAHYEFLKARFIGIAMTFGQALRKAWAYAKAMRQRLEADWSLKDYGGDYAVVTFPHASLESFRTGKTEHLPIPDAWRKK